jgi:4-hydroxybenzoate polyprenyltransferase
MKPGALSRLRGLVEASHPFPVAMVVSLTALMGFVSAGRDVDPWALLLAVLAMLLSQLAIGWSNDYLDRKTDALHQPDKPLARGLVEPRLLLGCSVLALTGSLAAGVALGAAALGLLVLGTGIGFSYNLWLKDTRFSWAPYVAAFAVLPPFVWAAVDAFAAEYWVLYPVGAPLVLGVHVANSLPDVEADRRAGRGGLIARLGRDGSLLLLGVCLLVPLVVIAISLAVLGYSGILLAASVGAYALLALSAGAVYLVRRDAAGADLGFRLVAPAAVFLAVGWLAAVQAA